MAKLSFTIISVEERKMSDKKNDEVKAENMDNSGKTQDVAILTQPQESAGARSLKRKKSQRRRKSL